MATLDIQKCPETGICSIMNGQGAKIDMISTEADQLKKAGGDHAKIKEVLAQVDPAFTESLTEAELEQLAQDFK